MQKREMRRVTFAFEPLQITAILQRFRNVKMIERHSRPFVFRKKRHAILRSHVRENDTRRLLTRIGGVVNLVFKVLPAGSAGVASTLPSTSYFQPW